MNAGDTQRASKGLAGVLAERRARGDIVFLPSRPDLAARFANLALEHGIETAYVRMLIDRHRLVAPDDACARSRRADSVARRKTCATRRADSEGLEYYLTV